MGASRSIRLYSIKVKRYPLILLAALFLFGCSRPALTTSPTPAPTPTPACQQPGTTRADRVLFPDSGEQHGFLLYLPPCYADSGATYPVLYWTSAGGQGIFDLADQLIRQGELPAFIIVMVDISPTQGFGADAQIVDAVVPYIDSHYRTQADRLHRSVTGISHGAAIAARAAFRPPNVFGRVAVLSGGIAEGEQEKFSAWIAAMPPGQRPAVLIDVGDQDGIILLTRHFTDLLDGLNYPYTYTHAPGDHTEAYWASHMADFLKWLVPAHPGAKPE
jgi:enterochelin esterase-like enzyme